MPEDKDRRKGKYSRRVSYGRRGSDRPTATVSQYSRTNVGMQEERRQSPKRSGRRNLYKKAFESERRGEFTKLGRRRSDLPQQIRTRLSEQYGSILEADEEFSHNLEKTMPRRARRSLTAGRRSTDFPEALKSGRPMTIDISNIKPKKLAQKAAKVGKKTAKKAGPLGIIIGIGSLAKEAKAMTPSTIGSYKGNKPILPKKPKVK